MTFTLHIDPPRATAQQKGINLRTGRHYTKARVQAAKDELAYALKPHAPRTPFDCPVRLAVHWRFKTANKRLFGTWKTTRPDTDNMVKLIKDVMTDVGFWRDDAQVVFEVLTKRWANSGSIEIEVSAA